MKKINLVFVTGLLLLFCAGIAPLAANDVVGEIVYLEGTIDIFRDGNKLDWRDVDIGAVVEEFDMVETGADGYVEIALSNRRGGNSVIVHPDTSFYFDVEEVKGESKTEFAVMTGAMAFRVKKLSGNEAFTVRTESVAMGVRGTQFKVTIAPEGSVLTTCDEGAVECSTEEGGLSMAKPGQVVQKISERELAAERVSPDRLDAFQREWFSAREDVFKSGAATFIKGYGARYIDLQPKFLEAYANLRSVEPQLRRLEGINDSGSMGTFFQIKGQVSSAVVKMRSILPLFENTFFRLEQLSGYHAQGYGRGMIDSNTSTGEFFAGFDSQSYEMKQRLSHSYYLLRLYQKLHELTGGGPSFMDAPFDGGSGMPQGNLPEGFGGSPF